jgi:tRNA(fMet)-specific endonuclease VapC
VLGELYYGAHASKRVEENLAKLAEFVDALVLFDFDAQAAKKFGAIKAEQRAKGKPIPTADAQIAAVARLHKLTVLTDDVHFAEIDRVGVENWLR